MKVARLLFFGAAAVFVSTLGVGGAWLLQHTAVLLMCLSAVTMVGACAVWCALRLRGAASELAAVRAELSRALGELKIEQAKEARRRKIEGRFAKIVSHELRTPLSVIQSSSELLEHYGDRWPVARRAEHFGRICRSVTSMVGLLERVTFLVQADVDGVTVSPSVVSLPQLCQETARRAECADGGRHPIELRVEAGQVDADPRLLRTIVENLLSNALKFSPEGRPVCVAAQATASEIVVAVNDQGIGISEEEREHIFEEFFRGNGAASTAGMGLGLAIVKHAVDAQRGRIDLASEVGRGTRVTVHLPIQRVQDERASRGHRG